MKNLNRLLAVICPSMALAILVPESVDGQRLDRPAQVEALKQEIWSDYSTVTNAQSQLPPDARAKGDALAALHRAERRPAIDKLWAFVSANPHDATALQALGLVFEWGDHGAASRALERLISDHADDDRLAPVLQAGYGNSLAAGKRAQLVQLLHQSRAPAVKGATLYLLALEALSDPKKGQELYVRNEALRQLKLVRDRYGDSPTILLGAGDQARLGDAASALIFKTERLQVGALLPRFSATDLNGRPVSSSQFAGKITLIDFWATWCPPCVAALPEVRSAYKSFSRQKLNVVSISGDADPMTVKVFADRNRIPWTQWRVGPSGRLSNDWSNGSYPLYILVDRHGRILAEGQRFEDISDRLKQGHFDRRM